MPLAPFILVALALVGLGDTLYLSYYQYLNAVPTCALAGCEQVLTSVYAKFFGVSLSYIGLVYYTYLLCLGALLVWEPNSRALRTAALLYTGVGFLLSMVFVFYIQLTLIGALCLYCMISAVTATTSCIVSGWHFRSQRVG
ncbi:MAG: vitamin K epoxide reductase family protein [Patescibacteria group bacterium]